MTQAIVQTDKTPQAITPDLFNAFLDYIDRGAKTTETYIINLRQFWAYMLFKGIRNPQRADVIAYRDYLGTEHDAIKLDTSSAAGWTYRTDNAGNRYTVKNKPNTIAQYLRSVCQFFKWTAAAGLYPDIAANIHAPKIRHDAHKKDALQPADVLAIENHIREQGNDEQSKRLLAMFLLSVTAGLRTIEIERADIKDLERRGGAAYLYIWGKGHSEADTKKPIALEVYNAVKEYIDSRSDNPSANSPLFVATGNRSGGQRIAARTIGQMLKKAMQGAGYDSDRLTAHSLRHTAGTNIMEISGDLYTTQMYMRHSNPATTEIYLHNDTEKQDAELAQKLYNRYHTKEQDAQPDKLEALIKNMNSAQLAKLAKYAAEIA